MKRAIAAVLLFMSLHCAALAEGSGIPSVGTKDLIDHPRDYDGMVVSFEGEAIGAPMRRGDWAWVNVLDSQAAMGIFLPSSYLILIENYGSNKKNGDGLKIRGVFHRACPDHGGDMDIHASSLTVVKRGTQRVHHASPVELALLGPSLILAALLFFLWRKREAAAKSGMGIV